MLIRESWNALTRPRGFRLSRGLWADTGWLAGAGCRRRGLLAAADDQDSQKQDLGRCLAPLVHYKTINYTMAGLRSI